MLCNVYIKESSSELRRIGISSSTPVFFVNLSQQVITKLKGMEVKGDLEIYLVQEDPYLKDLSNKWMNGGVQLPEIRIVERIVQAPPTIIEKTVEVPYEVEVIKEVIREVEVIKEVEVIREVQAPILVESASEVDEEGILIDTKVAFEDWKVKNVKPVKKEMPAVEVGDLINPSSGENQEYEIDFLPGMDFPEAAEDFLDLPTEIVDPLVEDTSMPILLTPDYVETPKETVIEEKEEVKLVRKTNKKKETKVNVVPTEFVVELTPEEEALYKDKNVEE